MRLLTENLAELLLTMKFIGDVPEGKVINFSRKCYDDPDHLYEVLLRTLSWTEGRKITIKKISEILDLMPSILLDYETTTFYPVILEHLLHLQKGLKTLKKTYENDEDTKNEIFENANKIKILLVVHKIELETISDKNNRFAKFENIERKLEAREETLSRMESYFKIAKNELENFAAELEKRRLTAIGILQSFGLHHNMTESVNEKIADAVKREGGIHMVKKKNILYLSSDDGPTLDMSFVD